MIRNLLLTITGIAAVVFASAQAENPLLDYLENKGIVIQSKELQISSHQYSLLSNFSFDAYRKYSERAFVQIEKGPLISLYSFSEMKEHGIAYDKVEAERKKGSESEQKTKHDILTLIRLGWNYLPHKNSETGY